jgi:uncharacterized hydrophobic protein (TIGR00271 family)
MTEVAVTLFTTHPGVAHLVVMRGVGVRPAADLVEADVAREATAHVLADLDALPGGTDCAVTVEDLAAAKSDQAKHAEEAAPGYGPDAVVWEEVEARTSEESELSWSYLALMAAAVLLAAVGVLIDSSVLIVGAMAIGPDYGPISGITVAAVERRWPMARRSVRALAVGYLVGMLAAAVVTLIARATSGLPQDYVTGHRPLTDFVSQPTGWSVVAALAAGIAGVVSLTSAKSSALVGVAVSVTTVPAAADVGVAAAAGNWSQAGGALLQLGINVSALLVAGIATLGLRSGRRRRRHAGG